MNLFEQAEMQYKLVVEAQEAFDQAKLRLEKEREEYQIVLDQLKGMVGEEEFVEGDIPVGSVWECITDDWEDVTKGSHYNITELDSHGDPVFYDDEGDYRDPSKYGFLKNFKRVK